MKFLNSIPAVVNLEEQKLSVCTTKIKCRERAWIPHWNIPINLKSFFLASTYVLSQWDSEVGMCEQGIVTTVLFPTTCTCTDTCTVHFCTGVYGYGYRSYTCTYHWCIYVYMHVRTYTHTYVYYPSPVREHFLCTYMCMRALFICTSALFPSIRIWSSLFEGFCLLTNSYTQAIHGYGYFGHLY